MENYRPEMYWQYKLLDTKPVINGDEELWYLSECTTTTIWPETDKHKHTGGIPKSRPLALNEAINAIMSYNGQDIILGDGKVCVLSCFVVGTNKEKVASIEPHILKLTKKNNRRNCEVIYTVDETFDN